MSYVNDPRLQVSVPDSLPDDAVMVDGETGEVIDGDSLAALIPGSDH